MSIRDMKPLYRWMLLGMVFAFTTLVKESMLVAMPQPHDYLQDNKKLKRIFFNVYTDSIKPVLNYYVAVDGECTDGSFLPLDEKSVIITSDKGKMSGMEWIAPKHIDFDKVTFKVVSKNNAQLTDEIIIYMRKVWNKEEGVLQLNDVLLHRK